VAMIVLAEPCASIFAPRVFSPHSFLRYLRFHH